MAIRRKKNWISGAVSAVLGLVCALVLCAVFYGTMVYQRDERALSAEATQAPLLAALGGGARATFAPIQQGMPAEQLFPGPLMELAADGASLVQQWAQDVQVGGKTCRTVTRVYTRADGRAVSLTSATPAAYLERLSEPGYEPQLITGFILADLDAMHAVRDDVSILAARDGEYVYLLEARADEQTLYALGASARRQFK